MAVRLTTLEISQKYDRFARWYDWLEGVPDLLRVSRLRRRLLRGARGRVLEIAVGTGDAEALPFSDHSFDTVVSSLSTRTFWDYL